MVIYLPDLLVSYLLGLQEAWLLGRSTSGSVVSSVLMWIVQPCLRMGLLHGSVGIEKQASSGLVTVAPEQLKQLCCRL